MIRLTTPFLDRRSRRGSASALIVLLLVLLVFFGVLSIVTAAADKRLADRRANWVQSYYQADQAAVSILAELRNAVTARPAPTDPGSLQAMLEKLLSGKSGVEILSSESSGRETRLWFRVQSGEQAIEVGATFTMPDTANGVVGLTVTRWTSWQEPFDYENTGGGIWKG